MQNPVTKSKRTLARNVQSDSVILHKDGNALPEVMILNEHYGVGFYDKSLGGMENSNRDGDIHRDFRSQIPSSVAISSEVP